MANGMNISYSLEVRDGFTRTFRSMERNINSMQRQVSGGLSRSLSGLSESAQGMARNLQEAFRSSRTNMHQFRESQIEVQHGYLELAQNSEEYVGRTGDLMSALQELGTQHRQVTDSMINNSVAMRMSFLQSIGTMLGASLQSNSIASNLQRIGNPLYTVNGGLLRVSGGLERIARNGAPAILALRALGPTASMRELQSQIRLINAGIMRMGAVALVAAGASILLYGALHQANMAMNPTYAAAFTGMIEKLKKAFQPMIELFGQIMTHVFNFVGAIAALAIKFNEAYPVLAKIIQGFLMLLPILTLILAPLAVGIGLFGGLSAAMNAVWMIIAPFVTGLATVLGTVALIAAAIVGLVAAFVLAYKHIEGFRNFINAAMEAIKNAFNIAFNFVKAIVISVMSEVSSFLSGILGDIKGFWSENGAAIMTIVRTYFTMIGAYISVVMAAIKAVFQIAWPIIVGIIKVAWALIQSVIGTAIKLVLGIISAAMKLLQGDWKGAWNTIKTTASSIMSSIIGYFKGINLREIGRNIIQGLVNGIGGMVGTVKKKVAEIANLIPDGVKKFLGIHSPSRVLMELGGYTGEGFAIGLGDQLAQIKAASNDMATAAIPKVPTRSVDYTVQNTPTQKPESTPRTYSVEIPLVVEGREIARAVVDDLDSLFAGKTRMDFRTQGGKR